MSPQFKAEKMKPSIHPQGKKTQPMPCIEIMQLLFYQIDWPAILDLESVGTGLSSDPILVPFRGNCFEFSSGVFEVLESDLFQDNFTMVI